MIEFEAQEEKRHYTSSDGYKYRREGWIAALEWMLKDFICKEGYVWVPGTFEYKIRQKIEEELKDD